MSGLEMLLTSLPVWALALCALLIGFSKTAIGGMALIAPVLTAPDTALLGAVLAPLVLVGTWIGRATIATIDQATFERLVTVLWPSPLSIFCSDKELR